MRSRTKLAVLSLAASSSLLLAACGGGGGTEAGGSDTGEPQRGGTLTVLEGAGYAGAWPTGIDPATNTTGGANQSQMNAIFGRLFKLGEGGKTVPGMATGYDMSEDGRTFKIHIRQGVEFSDGTPFDAEAVAWHFRRVVDSPCNCAPPWRTSLVKKNAITTEDDDTVVVRFTVPNGAFISQLMAGNANWVASPTALEKMGEEDFKIKPVGAGPFKVVSNKLSSELVLERNPTYYEKGKPYLDRLIFKSIGGEQAAYQAMLAGQGDAYEGMNITPLIQQARQNPQLTVTQQPATSPYVIQLNTKNEPFDDKRAREAIYYATDVNAIRKGLFNNWYPVSQSFTAPGGKFHHPTVPGYRTYDLEKAKSIVQDLGGMEVELGTLDAYVANQVNEALKQQWERAGIKTTIHSWQLSTLIKEFDSGEWQAMLQTVGAHDPATGVAVDFRFGSDSPYTGVWDPKLDQMLQDAVATVDEAERDRLYQEAAKYISDQAYAPIMFAFAPQNVVVKGVHGPGLTTKIPSFFVGPPIMWEDVWKSE